MSQFVIVPEPKGSDTFLELSSRTPKTSGRIFRKHILSKGPLFYGGKKFDIDDEVMNSLIKNFEEKKCDIVQVPLVDDANKHSEDPTRNIGEVVNLSLEDGKLYSYIDVRKYADDVGKTLLGASAMLSLNYRDTDTDQLVGPTLLHVAVTNRPHVLNLDDFEEVIAMSSSSGDEVFLLSEESELNPEKTDPKENNAMDLETLYASLKDDHGIDVEALQSQVTSLTEDSATLTAEKDELTAQVSDLTSQVAEFTAKDELAVTLSNAIKEAFGEQFVALSNADGESQAEALISVVAEAGERLTTQSAELVSLSGRIEGLESARKTDASTAAVEDLIRAGKILPANREAMIELHLSNAELFGKIVPDAPIIDLSADAIGTDETFESNTNLVSEEVNNILDRTK